MTLLLAALAVAMIGVVLGRRRRAPGPPVLDPEAARWSAQVRIPLDLPPLARHEVYEQPLHDALRGAALGEVCGGDSGGAGARLAVVELALLDPEEGVPLVLDVLRRQGAPAETVVAWVTPEGVKEARVGAWA